jgi:HSP20 family protein
MTTRFAPFRDVDLMTRSLLGPAPQASGPVAPMDAVRSDEGVTLFFDLPGIDPNSIDLSVERNVLTLSAERSWSPADGEQVVVHECRHGRVRRQLRLSDGLDLAAVAARFDNGVLTVRIPAAESSRPSRVEIETGPPSALGSAPVDTTDVDAASDN